MRGLLETPSGLLIVVGALLGANFPIGKIASGAGVPGMIWAALLSMSAAVLSGLSAPVRGRSMPLDGHHRRYFTVGIGSFVLGKRYGTIVWAGVAVIAAGVSLTVLARLNETKSVAVPGA